MAEVHWHVLQCDSVRLEPLRKRHMLPLFALIDSSRDHLRTWLSWVDSHQSPANTRSLIEAGEMQCTIDNGCLWGVWNRTGELVGVVDLQWIQWQHLAASLGYWLGKPFLGQGLMTQALNLLCPFVFNELGLNRLEVSVACENRSSLALVQRVGFSVEGRRRDYERLHGRFFDHFALALLARDPAPYTIVNDG